MLFHSPYHIPSLRRIRSGRAAARVVSGILLASLAPPVPLGANPSGGIVVHGDVHLSGAGSVLTVRQDSTSAIINWADFSVARGETTRFVQPGRDSAVLNRVTGGNPSEIHGAIRGNGNVFLINPNGILVGPGGSVDAHGVVLSTLDLEDGEFLAKGDLVFKGASEAGVTNLGRVQGIGGDVFLIGRTVTNRGELRASGRVGLAAGTEVLLKAEESLSGERVFVRAKGSGVGGTGIYNDGTIEGAAVELKAHGNIYALAINNKGSIRATGAVNEGGRVFLKAEGGRFSNSGSIHATTSNTTQSAKVLIAAAYARVDGRIRAESGGGRGGEIGISATKSVAVGGVIEARGIDEAIGGSLRVEADDVEIAATARMDVSGGAGGQIKVGGGFHGTDPTIRNARQTRVAAGSVLIADARGDGDAGNVVVWSDRETAFHGDISAEALGGGFGGRVEVSGKVSLEFDGTVSTLGASPGRNGQVLLDPTDFSIVSSGAGANRITAAALVNLLSGGNVVISTLDGAIDPGQAGDITVAPGANVAWANANSLTLLAHRHIQVGANLRNAGSGGIHLIAGWDGATGTPAQNGAHRPASVLTAASFAEGSYGNGGGSVYIGDGQQNQRISVGSRDGDTQVAAYDLVVRSRDADTNSAQRNSQLGFFDGSNPGAPSTLDHPGNISVRAVSDIQVLGGTNARAWAQIGHGGNVENVATGSRYSGSITLAAGRDVTVAGPTVANTGVRSYAQIGHGGAGNGGEASGTIQVVAARDVKVTASAGNFAYAQIGHGGYGGSGEVSGTLVVEAGRSLTLTGGANSNNYAQIGHGGGSSSAAASGEVQIRAGVGGILARAGTAAASYVQIGHGGTLASASSFSGDIRVASEGSIVFDRTAGNVLNAHSSVGHGGSGATGIKSGRVEVESRSGDILFGTNRAGVGRSGVQIGHGGRDGTGDTSGSILVNAPLGSIRFHGTFAADNVLHREGYAQIGHGGRENAGNHGSTTDLIEVTAWGGIEFLAGGAEAAGEAAQGREAYAQVGNGGYLSNGNHSGDIRIKTGGDIRFDTRGESGDRSYVQVGHGGYFSSGRFSGAISVDGGSLAFLAGRSASYALLGHGGRNDHDSTRDNSGPDGTANTADDVRIPVNAAYAPGTIHGDIAVLSQGNILFRGGFGAGATGFAQIGHGGYQQSAASGEGHSGDISVISSAGAIALEAGTRNSQHAMIGHGGHESFGNHRGNILVEALRGVSLVADGGTVTVAGGDVRSFAQIGHGGVDSDFATDRVYGNFGVVNGAAGFNPGIPVAAPGTVSGDISVRVTGAGAGLTLTASQGGTNLGLRGYAQVGHGGLLNQSRYEGDILVEVQDDIRLVAGTVRDSHAQIGHGGGLGSGDIAGALRVVTGGDLLLTGGGFATSNARIGHGGITSTGARAPGARSGAFVIEVGGTTRLVDGISGAFIGHLAANGLGAGSPFSLISGGLDFNLSQVTLGALIAAAISSGDVTLALTSGDLEIRGDGYTGLSDHQLALFAAGEVRMLTSAQLEGAGLVDVVAGWDGLTGRGPAGSGRIDLAPIESNPASWGRNGAFVRIGDGTQTTAAALGTREGVTRLYGAGASVSGGAAPGTSARLGYESNGSGSPVSGSIQVKTRSGGVDLSGGSGFAASAQIGNGGRLAASISGVIDLSKTPAGALHLRGGTGAGSHAQLGHGSVFHEGTLSGELVLDGGFETIELIGGTGQNAFSQIGHGGLNGRGSISGTIDLATTSLSLSGGRGNSSYARIGHGGSGSAGTIGGDVLVRSGAAGLALSAGRGNASYVQIGHGGLGTRASVPDAAIRVFSGGAVSGEGGSALQAYVQIGHGGSNAASRELGGEVLVEATGELRLVAGRAGWAYTQIGHGGASADGDFGGGVTVATEASLHLESKSPGEGAYALIGHGDDLRADPLGRNGTGLREGVVRVTAGRDITLASSRIGHAGGATVIAVAGREPANPIAGRLSADATSVLASGGGLRIYLPRRGNNRIVPGVLINGERWAGPRPDPSPVQGPEEYTRHITGVVTGHPGEHDSVPGSGPAPRNGAGYAFYYDTIAIGPQRVQVTGPLPPVVGPPDPIDPIDPTLPVEPAEPGVDAAGLVEDWQRELLEQHSRTSTTAPRYEGFEHYDTDGEVSIEGLLDWYFPAATP